MHYVRTSLKYFVDGSGIILIPDPMAPLLDRSIDKQVKVRWIWDQELLAVGY